MFSHSLSVHLCELVLSEFRVYFLSFAQSAYANNNHNLQVFISGTRRNKLTLNFMDFRLQIISNINNANPALCDMLQIHKQETKGKENNNTQKKHLYLCLNQ